MVKKEKRYDLVHNEHKKLVNSRKYIVIQRLYVGAKLQ